jgi:TPR repeat protein
LFELECWGGEPDSRPTINQVVDLLKAMITETELITENPQLSNVSNEQEINETILSFNNSESQGELSKLIQNFNKINIKEIDPIAFSSEREKLLIEEGFDRIVDEVNDYMIKMTYKKIEWKLLKQQVIDYFNNYNINMQEIYYWLVLNTNQKNSNSIFLLGYFNFFGIETDVDLTKAFNLFFNASEKSHVFAQFFVGNCYQHGNGTIKDGKLAFEYYEKSANNNFTPGQLDCGYCYLHEIGIKKDIKKALYWYKKAASNGNTLAMLNLGDCYLNGNDVEKDYNKAFELFN